MALTSLLFAGRAVSIALPSEFAVATVLDGLQDPAGVRFSADGSRLFIGERITGALRVAEFSGASGLWELKAAPFHVFDVPKDGGGNPERHRSGGLRGFVFDPAFATNGYVYAFYTRNNPRHNRVVRIKADAANPDVAESGSETVLFELPFNSSGSSGSHNGGDLAFGGDGKLYFTTGDGWNGGDPVQSLTTFTGKVFRLNPDGSIPADNPFSGSTTGDYRAIYGLGLRNPYSMSFNGDTGELFINDAVGSQKDTVYLVAPGANYGHQGTGGGGTPQGALFNGGGKLITGGAWYPTAGPTPRPFPAAYHGSYLMAFWDGNGSPVGEIRRALSRSNLSTESFATSIGIGGDKPVLTRIGPHDGNLYFLLTDYETGTGKVKMINFTGQPSVEAPVISPSGGQHDDPVTVSISTSTPAAEIYFTTDGSAPDQAASLYTVPFVVTVSQRVQARAIKNPDLQPSPIASADFIIGPVPNTPPVSIAGPDSYALVNTLVRVNGSASFDPDGDPLEIGESWEQISGPPVAIGNSDEAEGYFTPTIVGEYVLRITITDIDGASHADEVMVTVLDNVPDVLDGLVARWSFEEGVGLLALDSSAGASSGILSAAPGVGWNTETPDLSRHALRFGGGADDRVDLGNLDIGSDRMSIAFWFKADDFGTHDARFISKASGQQDAQHYWMVSTVNGSELRFRLKAGGTTTTLISPTGTLATGVWTHVAAVYDGAAMRLYKDGVEVAATAKTGLTDTSPNVFAAIGNQPGSASGGARPFDGLLDELRIYGRGLSPGEVVAVRDATRPMVVVGYVGWTASHGLTNADAFASADPDGDRLSNLIEYGLALPPDVYGTSPVEPSLLEPIAGQSHAALTFTAQKLATDVVYLVQVSDDLEVWNDGARYSSNGLTLVRDGAITTVQAAFVSQGATVRITERDGEPLGNPPGAKRRRFMRLVVLR